jgi:hypothetical protein
MNTSTKGNGYINLNGLIIQWGEEPVTKSSTATYTFNIPFTNASSVVCVKNYQSARSSGTGDREISIWEITTTGFNTHCTADDTKAFQWLAIGY